MKLIDVHSHLQFDAFDSDREEVIKQNLEDLHCLINVGTDLKTSLSSLEIAKKHDHLFTSFGIHPHHALEQTNFDFLKEFENNFLPEKVVAIGEIGLDHFPGHYNRVIDETKQKEVLLAQIELAKKLNLPVIFHCREAYDELYELIKKENLRGLVHCWMGTETQAKKFLDLGLSIAFCGNITYKTNQYLRDIAKNLPLEALLVETDAPFLPPEPFRGQRNEPRYVRIIAKLIASLKGSTEEETFTALNSNAQKLFDLNL